MTFSPADIVSQSNSNKRVAIVYGLRTPFVKSGTLFRELSSLDLGKTVVVELLNRTEIDPEEIDKVIFGTVLPSIKTSNLAREISLGSGVPVSVPAFTVTSACASATQAFTNGVSSILSGDSEAVLVGGVESISDFPVLFSKSFRTMLFDSSKGKNIFQKAKPFLKMGVGDIAPDVPAIAERSTGLTMGESAEKMARQNQISRRDQDEFALRSHSLAAKAQNEEIFRREMIKTFVPPDFEQPIFMDSSVKSDLDIETLSQLKPAFDREYGTVTSGNSAPLSDGACALLLMSEERAKALGFKPLGYVRSYAYAAVNPKDQLLMGPAYSTPLALDKAGLSLKDMDLLEIHEAFSSQVLSNIRAFASKKFAEEKLSRTNAVGEIDMDKVNVTGGSIAIGHPFGATGGRIILTLLHALQRRQVNFGLATLCAAGGLGASIILERE
ncbi:MAG: 3-ketoacyl-CoA thiolase [Thermodesulfobacteriota bacterium]|nr:MAG: 3-ketoacyl-CoA thiolase [Thermodesulfobacteriota bacterium]